MKKIALASLLFVASSVFAASVPVPGRVDQHVRQSNIDKTICVKGYTATVRPHNDYTKRLKLKQIKEFGLPGTAADYYEDHLISLELGGDPKDPKNLFPQPIAESKKKDVIEDKLHDLVCSKQITLSEAQRAIAKDWQAAYTKYVTVKAKK